MRAGNLVLIDLWTSSPASSISEALTLSLQQHPSPSFLNMLCPVLTPLSTCCFLCPEVLLGFLYLWTPLTHPLRTNAKLPLRTSPWLPVWVKQDLCDALQHMEHICAEKELYHVAMVCLWAWLFHSAGSLRKPGLVAHSALLHSSSCFPTCSPNPQGLVQSLTHKKHLTKACWFKGWVMIVHRTSGVPLVLLSLLT